MYGRTMVLLFVPLEGEVGESDFVVPVLTALMMRAIDAPEGRRNFE